jgi:hypothetical protein
MKISYEQRDKRDYLIRQRMSSLRKMENFCHSYDSGEADEMLSRLLAVLRAGSFLNLDQADKESMLDYIEALEELLPAVDEVNRFLTTLIRSGESYQDRLQGRRFVASLKVL